MRPLNVSTPVVVGGVKEQARGGGRGASVSCFCGEKDKMARKGCPPRDSSGGFLFEFLT